MCKIPESEEMIFRSFQKAGSNWESFNCFSQFQACPQLCGMLLQPNQRLEMCPEARLAEVWGAHGPAAAAAGGRRAERRLPPSPQRALAPWGVPSRSPRQEERQRHEQQLLRGPGLNPTLGDRAEAVRIGKKGWRSRVQRARQRAARSRGRHPGQVGMPPRGFRRLG